MRRHGRTDANQWEIIQALEAIGCTVMTISGAGGNRPDIIAARAGETWSLEIKNPHGRNRVSAGQQRWQETWCGKCAIVRTVDEALALFSIGP